MEDLAVYEYTTYGDVDYVENLNKKNHGSELLQLWFACRLTIALLLRNTFVMAAAVAMSLARSHGLDWKLTSCSGVAAIVLVPTLTNLQWEQVGLFRRGGVR